MDVSFQIPESIFTRVRKNEGKSADIKVTFDTYPERQYPAVVTEVDTEADPKTQTYKIKARMDYPTEFIALEGMSVTVNVDFSQVLIIASDKIIVPVEAVFAPEDKALESKERFVWQVNTDTMRVKLTPVSVGQITSDGIEIIDGIKPGEQIVAAGVHFITENQQIKPWVKERGL